MAIAYEPKTGPTLLYTQDIVALLDRRELVVLSSRKPLSRKALGSRLIRRYIPDSWIEHPACAYAA